MPGLLGRRSSPQTRLTPASAAAFPVDRPRAYPPLVGCIEAVLVDAGGVLVLPDRQVLSAALGFGPWREVPEVLDRAHYLAVAAVDEVRPPSDPAIIPV